MNEALIKNAQKIVINNHEGQKYPCGNQSVRKIIYIKKFDEKIKKYLEELGAKPSNHRPDNYTQKVFIDGELWLVIIANQLGRGYRAYEAKVDKRIDDYVFSTFVCPSFGCYCHEVEFF